MIRKIIQINEEKCNGCGACAAACHEGAIAMVNGKARLMRDEYCDGLGDCLPACPTGAISFVMREAAAYDEAAVLENKKQKAASAPQGCPGQRLARFARSAPGAPAPSAASCLAQWPCQLRLVPVNALFFDGADILVAADCTAYAYAGMHTEFMRGRVTLIGCPKLDDADYEKKLTAIFRENDVHTVTVVRMEVPCCGGLEHAVVRALAGSGRRLLLTVVTVSTDGKILNREEI